MRPNDVPAAPRVRVHPPPALTFAMRFPCPRPMPSRLLPVLALVLAVSACDTVEEPAQDPSSFEATVSGARTARLEGHAWTDTHTFGETRRQILLDAGAVGGNEGGITFVRAADTTLVPGTYSLFGAGPYGEAFSTYLTLSRTPTEDDPSTAETFYGLDGALTLTAVTADSVVGSFRFRAGPLPGSAEDLATVEGRFVAAR